MRIGAVTGGPGQPTDVPGGSLSNQTVGTGKLATNHALELSLTVALHAMAFTQLVLEFGDLHLPHSWLGQSIFLLGLSCFLSVCGYLLRGRVSGFVVLAGLRFVVLLILCYPLGTYVNVELTLLSSLSFDCGANLRPRVSIPVVFIALAIALFAKRPAIVWGRETNTAGLDELIFLGAYPTVILALTCVVWQYRNLISKQKDIVLRLKTTGSRLVETNLRLQDFVALQEEQAVLLERKRVSREIHDTIGHALMGIILMGKAAIGLIPEGRSKLRELLEHTQEQAQEGMNETRRALSLLRNREVPKPPLLLRVERLIRAFDGTNLDIRVEYGNSAQSYGEEVDSIVFRFVQEGITNSIRHGDATHVFISFWRQDGEATVTILDDGIGADEFGVGIGLKGMQERLSEIGGGMSAGNVPKGFRLSAKWPAGSR